jgi:hypothetical protein
MVLDFILSFYLLPYGARVVLPSPPHPSISLELAASFHPYFRHLDDLRGCLGAHEIWGGNLVDVAEVSSSNRGVLA